MTARRRDRLEMIERFESVDSPRALFEFQVALADAIRGVEPTAYSGRDDDARFHLRQLRLIGDAVAWRLLHPYAVRKLAGPAAAPPSLISQGEAFDRVLEFAEQCAGSGALVLIADVTNVIGIGDLIICNDRERPGVLESGGSAEHLGKGRKGRQMMRALAVLRLLHTGEAKLEGLEALTQTIEIDTELDHSWSAVEVAAGTALKVGKGGRAFDAGDVVWGVRADERSAHPPPEVESALERMHSPCVSWNSYRLEHPTSFVPPPLEWPLPHDVRIALFERELRLIHVVDLDAFCRVHPGGRITEAQLDGRSSGRAGIVVSTSAGDVRVATRFIEDVLDGYQTIETTAHSIIDFVLASQRLDDATVDDPTDKPTDVARIEDGGEAASLLSDPEAARKWGYVALPIEFYDRLVARKDAARDPAHTEDSCGGLEHPRDVDG